MDRAKLLLGVITLIALVGHSYGDPESKIAFQRFAGGPLLLMDVDGSDQRPITKEPGSFPSWSPDHTELALERGGYIYIVNLDGSDERKVVHGMAPAWSPGGKEISFSRVRSEVSKADLYVVETTSIKERKVAEGLYPSWSPDGKRIAYSNLGLSLQWAVDRSTKVYTVAIDGSSMLELTDGFMPSWSPDGSQMLFLKIDGGPLFGGESSVSMYVMDVVGDKQVRLVEGIAATEAVSFGLTRSGSWSPDGSKIVFAKMEETAPNTSGAVIYVMDADGGNQVKIAEGVNPAWSPLFEVTTHVEETSWGETKSGSR